MVTASGCDCGRDWCARNSCRSTYIKWSSRGRIFDEVGLPLIDRHHYDDHHRYNHYNARTIESRSSSSHCCWSFTK